MSTFSTRSTTWTMSALRSRRYSSSICSNCSTTCSICCTSAHSALQRRSRMSWRVAVDQHGIGQQHHGAGR
jgi:hypothetical protein